jgi:hypothetical protein
LGWLNVNAGDRYNPERPEKTIWPRRKPHVEKKEKQKNGEKGKSEKAQRAIQRT